MSEQAQARTAASWDPQQYLRFSDHRLRPALELLDRVPLAAPSVVYDLGCGSGNVTQIMAERWPAARVTGMDNSPAMLAQAAALTGAIQWQQADIQTWRPETPPDLIYTNAALQWVEGHRELFPRLVSFLQPGGCLAVQMPLSWPMPSHVLMRETLERGGPGGRPFGTEALRRGVARKWVEDAAVYYDLLLRSGVSDIDIWETEYLQVLHGPDPVLEWVKGSGLRPILDGLEGAERDAYLREYAQRLRDAYPTRDDGDTLYPFRRLFIVAVR